MSSTSALHTSGSPEFSFAFVAPEPSHSPSPHRRPTATPQPGRLKPRARNKANPIRPPPTIPLATVQKLAQGLSALAVTSPAEPKSHTTSTPTPKPSLQFNLNPPAIPAVKVINMSDSNSGGSLGSKVLGSTSESDMSRTTTPDVDESSSDDSSSGGSSTGPDQAELRAAEFRATEARKAKMKSDHFRLLEHRPEEDELNEIKATPIFTEAVREYANSLATNPKAKPFAQYGLLAGDISGLTPASSDNRLFWNISAPSSFFICGSQGSGKSHTLSCLLENALGPGPATTLPRPLTGIVFHYDTFVSDTGGSPCEAAWLASNKGIKVRVLCPPTNVRTLKAGSPSRFRHPRLTPTRRICTSSSRQ